MQRRQFFAALGAGFVVRTGGAQAAGGDPRFPAALVARIGGKAVRLVLTGTAERTKYLFRVYGVGSYLQEGVRVRSPEGLAALDAPKLLHLIFERDVDGATMGQAFRASIGRGHPAPAFASELTLLERYFLASPIRAGDQIRLTHITGKGLGVQVNAQPEMVIGSVPFACAAWGTYFGHHNIGVAIKSGLSSRL